MTDLLDETDKANRSTLDQFQAELGGSGCGVTGNARGMKILRLPSEIRRTAAEQFRLPFDRNRHRRKILGMFHLHEFGVEMEHHAGLDLPAMDAVLDLG